MLADDLMVSVGISEARDCLASQNGHGIHFTYWQGIIPQDIHELAKAQHLTIIHTSSASFEPGNPHRVESRWLPKETSLAPMDPVSFCGWDKPLSFIRLELAPAYLDQIMDRPRRSQSSSSQGPQVFHIRDEAVLQMSRWLLNEPGDGSIAGEVYLHSLANTLALRVLRHRTGSAAFLPSELPGSVSPEIGHAIEYMTTYLDRDISLATLAQAIHLSPSYFARLFKRSTGTSPHQYLIRLRVAHARQLLLSGIRPIAEVARQTGFADQSHLTRHFKRMYNVTPKDILDGRSRDE